MAGSMKWFKYTTDTGTEFGLWMDESNGEVVGNEDFGNLDNATITYAMPRNVKPRTALYSSSDNRVSRRIPVTDPEATISTLPASMIVDAIDGNPSFQLNLRSFRGEEIRRLTGVDTGLTDGDDT